MSWYKPKYRDVTIPIPPIPIPIGIGRYWYWYWYWVVLVLVLVSVLVSVLMLLVLTLHLKNQITEFWKTDYRFGFLDPENLWSNFIKNRYFLKMAYSWRENQELIIDFSKLSSLIFSSEIRSFEKVTIFYKVWSKVFGVKEFESVIGFSKFCNLSFEMEGQYQ